MASELSFILGGARSGKSHYAEQRAMQQGQRVLYVATAQAFDDEMRDRIARHRSERPAEWDTLEAPLQTAQAIAERLAESSCDLILLDCITLLASNILLTLPDNCSQDDANAAILAEVDVLLRVQAASQQRWLLVSNEVGMGIVPPTRLGRLYRDALGRANQRIAQAADEVLLLVAGLPWQLKRP